MAFEDRSDAARRLVERLSAYKGRHPVVFAIPRGAVPMARIIADGLGGELDIVMVRKLRAPENPELAIGSIDDHGHIYLDPDATYLWTNDYLTREIELQLGTLRQRRMAYGLISQHADLTDRVAIVVDDGVATGSTMIAALRAIRARKPGRLVAATAVAPTETVRLLRKEADDVVCVETPAVLYAIGLHFRDFSQVSDDEVQAILQEAHVGAPLSGT